MQIFSTYAWTIKLSGDMMLIFDVSNLHFNIAYCILNENTGSSKIKIRKCGMIVNRFENV